MIPSLEPPPGMPAPSRRPDAPAPGMLLSAPPGHHAFCYGCGERHPAGLYLQVRAGAGVRVSADFEVGELHQGPPGLAHGGVLAAVFDEVLNYLVWMLRAGGDGPAGNPVPPPCAGRLPSPRRRGVSWRVRT